MVGFWWNFCGRPIYLIGKFGRFNIVTIIGLLSFVSITYCIYSQKHSLVRPNFELQKAGLSKWSLFCSFVLIEIMVNIS